MCDKCQDKGCASCGYAGVTPCPHEAGDATCTCSVREMNAAEYKREREQQAMDYLQTLADRTGVACSTVKDGSLLIFKRSFLKELVEKNPDKEKLVIFVKRPEMH